MDKITLTRGIVEAISLKEMAVALTFEFTIKDGEYRITEEIPLDNLDEFVDIALERIKEGGESVMYVLLNNLAPECIVAHNESVRKVLEGLSNKLLALKEAQLAKRLQPENLQALEGTELDFTQSIDPEEIKNRHQQFEQLFFQAERFVRNQQYDAALPVLEQCLRVEPEATQIYLLAAEIEHRRKEPINAYEWLMRMVELGQAPPVESSVRILEKLRSIGRHNEADIYLQHLAEVAPKDPNVLHEKAWKRYHQGRDPSLVLDPLFRENPNFTRSFLLNQWRYTRHSAMKEEVSLEDAAEFLDLHHKDLLRLARRQSVPCRYLPMRDRYVFYQEELDWYKEFEARYGFLKSVRGGKA